MEIPTVDADWYGVLVLLEYMVDCPGFDGETRIILPPKFYINVDWVNDFNNLPENFHNRDVMTPRILGILYVFTVEIGVRILQNILLITSGRCIHVPIRYRTATLYG